MKNKAMFAILTFSLLLVLFVYGCSEKQDDSGKQSAQISASKDTARVSTNQAAAGLSISSPAFKNNEQIPRKYTCDLSDVNPQIDIAGIPQNAKSLVLIMYDPDAPSGIWNHWILYNIPVAGLAQLSILEASSVGTPGKNSWGKTSYGGPCPPSGTHRYIFKFYALDSELSLPKSATRAEIERMMPGHVLAEGELIGLYKRL